MNNPSQTGERLIAALSAGALDTAMASYRVSQRPWLMLLHNPWGTDLFG